MKLKKIIATFATISVISCSIPVSILADTGTEINLQQKNEFQKRADALENNTDRIIKTSPSQAEANHKSGELSTKWDNLLNDVYQYLEKTLPSSDFAALKNDQAEWIKQRYIESEKASKDWEGGTAFVLANNSAYIPFTAKRTYYLISLIKANQPKTIPVYFNGKELSFSQPPYIENGTTMVPMRVIFEALGAAVDYNAETKAITAVKDNTTVKLIIGSSSAEINNSKKTLSAPVVNKNGTAMIPLRFVSEALGANVNWNADSKAVTIQA